MATTDTVVQLISQFHTHTARLFDKFSEASRQQHEESQLQHKQMMEQSKLQVDLLKLLIDRDHRSGPTSTESPLPTWVSNCNKQTELIAGNDERNVQANKLNNAVLVDLTEQPNIGANTDELQLIRTIVTELDANPDHITEVFRLGAPEPNGRRPRPLKIKTATKAAKTLIMGKKFREKLMPVQKARSTVPDSRTPSFYLRHDLSPIQLRTLSLAGRVRAFLSSRLGTNLALRGDPVSGMALYRWENGRQIYFHDPLSPELWYRFELSETVLHSFGGGSSYQSNNPSTNNNHFQPNHVNKNNEEPVDLNSVPAAHSSVTRRDQGAQQTHNAG